MKFPVLTASSHGKQFKWRLRDDQAEIADTGTNRTVWTGSLLPSFDIVQESGRSLYVRPTIERVEHVSDSLDRMYTVHLDLGAVGEGRMTVGFEQGGVRFSDLRIRWQADTAIVALYFGAKRLSAGELQRAPSIAQPHWPDWSAEGYCIPCTRSNPTGSFWRSWDMGDSLVALGSFGDAMGTPYTAAFPRPLLAAAMGGTAGWASFGPGDIPDAPLSLKLKAATACLQYDYRDDLWGPIDPRERVWREPLRIAWGETGYAAFDALFRTFPVAAKSPDHLRSFACTWGDFKEGRYDLTAYANRVAADTPADMVILDDSWESYCGSGDHHEQRFPAFAADIAHMKERGLQVGFWQALAWIDRPEEAGLDAGDLLCGRDGKPRLWTWSGNPLADAAHYHYVLDPSSAKARSFLVERTQKIIRRWQPAALKLDFGYGVPGPDVCAPRSHAYRGERFTAELIKLVGLAAKAVKPDITIIYYGIHPLMLAHVDMISLDDLGDAGHSGRYEALGHNQRCMWAALAGPTGLAINTSTGYFFNALEPILLHTAVVGANGITLGERDADGRSLSPRQINRWQALNRWRRKTGVWSPVWLEADMGGLGSEPFITSWAREERIDGRRMLTAAVLQNRERQDGAEDKQYAGLAGVRFTGAWALIAQDDEPVTSSRQLVCIPFEAGTLRFDRPFRCLAVYKMVDRQVQRTGTLTRAELPALTLRVSESELAEIVAFMVLA